jgi:hypothetical protein
MDFRRFFAASLVMWSVVHGQAWAEQRENALRSSSCSGTSQAGASANRRASGWGTPTTCDGWGAPGRKKQTAPSLGEATPIKKITPVGVAPSTTIAAPASVATAASRRAADVADAAEPGEAPTIAVVPAPAPPPAAVTTAPLLTPLAGVEGVVIPRALPAPPVQVPVRLSLPRPAPKFRHWLELQTVTASVRYREVETSAGVRTTNQMQDSEVIKGRVKFDPSGAYTLNANVSSGTSITGGWNTTGVGTGVLVTNLYLKQLYFAAAPTRGFELQYGGLPVVRGETTEVTTYDNDVYLVGARASVRRPKEIFFDEISLTQAYLGDSTAPGFLHRYQRLDEVNYHQVLLGKKITSELSVSADYTRVDGVGTTHAGLTYKHHLPLLDVVRYEQYGRSGPQAGSGFSAYGEKSFGTRATAGVGWATIDANIGSLTGDRFGKGRRFFTNGSLTLSPELSASVFYTHGADNEFAVANQQRLDVILTYNVLKTMQRTGLF